MFKRRMLALLVIIVLLAGCSVDFITGSGNMITQQEDFNDFDRLDVSHGFKVDVHQGDRFSVVIRVDDNLLDDVQVAKQGGTLKIGLKPGSNYSLQNVTLEADITMPELTGLDMSGGSHITINDFSIVNTLDVDMSGGSYLGGDVEAGDVTIELSGGSHATLSGSAGDLTVNASGGSHAKLADLAVVDAEIEVSGGSHATVNASGSLDVEASGGSHVTYLGSPTLGMIDLSGSSNIGPE